MGVVSTYGNSVSLTAPAPSISDPITITPTGSPFTYTAPANGIVFFSGGTVSLVSYVRNSQSLSLGALSGSSYVQIGDQLAFVYVTSPTIKFVPIS